MTLLCLNLWLLTALGANPDSRAWPDIPAATGWGRVILRRVLAQMGREGQAKAGCMRLAPFPGNEMEVWVVWCKSRLQRARSQLP